MRYASLARWGAPVAEEVLTAMQPAIPLPVDLVTFYRRQESLAMGESLCNPSIISLDALRPAQTSQHPYARFHSMGLADSINRVWGNARPELDPVGAQEEVDRLNGDYQVVAVWNDADRPSEAHFYIYFDHTQRFGIVRLHQDDWERWPTIELPDCPLPDDHIASDGSTDSPSFSTKLEPSLEASGANRSWDQVLNDALDWIEDRSNRYE